MQQQLLGPAVAVTEEGHRLRELGLLQPGKEKARGKRESGISVSKGDRLFSRICCDRKRGNGFKLKEGRFTLDVTKRFFTIQVVRHWHRLPREVVDAASLETFKVRLEGF